MRPRNAHFLYPTRLARPDVPGFVDERLQALLACRWKTLDGLLDEDLCYVHATGVRHDKTQYLDFVKERIRVLAIELEMPQAKLCGDMAVITGRLRQTIVRATEVTSH